MGTDNRPCLRRLRCLWSDTQTADDPNLAEVTALQLRAMTFTGIKRFTEWWLGHLRLLPVNAFAFAGTIRVIVRIWPTSKREQLRKTMRQCRHALAVEQLHNPPVEERERCKGLERSLIHMLLTNWDR